jgi:hypothetical protein
MRLQRGVGEGEVEEFGRVGLRVVISLFELGPALEGLADAISEVLGEAVVGALAMIAAGSSRDGICTLLCTK